MRRRRGRPCLRRKINFNPRVKYFKPQGAPMATLDVVELKNEELEAMRLKNLNNLDQKDCAELMNTSPATLQRILSNAYQKVADALVKGKAIRVVKE